MSCTFISLSVKYVKIDYFITYLYLWEENESLYEIYKIPLTNHHTYRDYFPDDMSLIIYLYFILKIHLTLSHSSPKKNKYLIDITSRYVLMTTHYRKNA